MKRVKICGIRNFEEAKMCVELGADALGFLVGLTHFSEDKLSPSECASIIAKLPPFVNKVLVTHLDDVDEIIAILKETSADTVQLHTDAEYINMTKLRYEMPYIKIIRAVHVTGVNDLDRAYTASAKADAILLDTKTDERLGGTGLTHNWDISREIRTLSHKPVVLAGGLNIDNLKSAIEKVDPFSVDVNSGVEDEKGNKDYEKVKRFIEIAKGVNI